MAWGAGPLLASADAYGVRGVIFIGNRQQEPLSVRSYPDTVAAPRFVLPAGFSHRLPPRRGQCHTFRKAPLSRTHSTGRWCLTMGLLHPRGFLTSDFYDFFFFFLLLFKEKCPMIVIIPFWENNQVPFFQNCRSLHICFRTAGPPWGPGHRDLRVLFLTDGCVYGFGCLWIPSSRKEITAKHCVTSCHAYGDSAERWEE